MQCGDRVRVWARERAVVVPAGEGSMIPWARGHISPISLLSALLYSSVLKLTSGPRSRVVIKVLDYLCRKELFGGSGRTFTLAIGAISLIQRLPSH